MIVGKDEGTKGKLKKNSLSGMIRYRTLFSYQPAAMPDFLRHTLMSRIQNSKKAEMAKTIRNGLSMIETNPLNHNWSDFEI